MNQKINPEIAEILGAFIGDGWLESSLGSIYITGDKIEDKDYYDKYLGPLFSKNFAIVTPREFSYWNVYGIGCSKKHVILKCLNLGFQPGTKALTAEIPKSIIESEDTEIIKSLLRGIFDADGSFWCEKSRSKFSIIWKKTYHYRPELQIGSCSKKLLKQIKFLLDKFEIESKVRLRNKKGFKNNRNTNNHYGLRIRKKEQIRKFFKIISSSNPRHQTRYKVWETFGFLPPRTNINQRKLILAKKLDPYSLY